MFQETLDRIIDFFRKIFIESSEPATLWISLVSLVIIIIAITTGLIVFKKQLRTSNIKRMISYLSPLDLMYYSLEKHFKTWKTSNAGEKDPIAGSFWKKIDLTETVTRLQELKTLSNTYLNKKTNIEINSLLEYLGDIILISYRGQDLSDKGYMNLDIINSDEFSLIIDNLINKLSRGIGVKINKSPAKDITGNYIKEHFLH